MVFYRLIIINNILIFIYREKLLSHNTFYAGNPKWDIVIFLFVYSIILLTFSACCVNLLVR